MVLDGDPWLERRKVVGPPLHGEQIASFRKQIEQIASERIDSWPIGEVIAMRPLMQEITLEVILRVVFGISDGADREKLRSLLPALIESAQWMIWAPPRLRDPIMQAAEKRPKLRRWLPFGKGVELRQQVDQILYSEIRSRREDGGPEDRQDVLSMMIAARDEDGEPMSEVELRDQLITLLEAGHETTATALAWSFERLARSEEVLDRLTDLIRDEDEDATEYLEATVKETLRARTVVFDTIRKLDRPLSIGRYTIPAGWLAGPATALIHHLSAYYEQPEEFRPDRFIGEDASFHAWFPFGGGQRRCVGSNLAQMEMAVVLEEALGRFDITPVGTPSGRIPDPST